MSDSLKTTLGDLVDSGEGHIQTGPFGSQLHARDYVEDGVPVVMPQQLGNNEIRLDGISRVGEQDRDRLARHVMRAGDIVFSRRGDVTRRAYITAREDGWLCGTGCLLLRLSHPGCDNRYLVRFLGLHEARSHLMRHAIGATMPNLNQGILASVPVVLPSRKHQERIVEVVSAYDELIENNRRRIQLLDEAARLLYKEWFVHLRFPGHEHGSTTDDLPEGWKATTVGTRSTLTRGRSYRSSELVESGGRLFVNLKCIARHGGFRLDGLKRLLGRHKDGQTVSAGDVVVALTDMTRERHVVAHAARVPAVVNEDAAFSMDTVKVTPAETVDRGWFYYFLRYSEFSKTVRESATGTNVLHLKPKEIEAYRFRCPPRPLQERFGEVIRDMLGQQDSLMIQNQKLIQARDLLLPRLMNGEIVV